MPSSIVEKYQKIFAADPRSRIFVELARALVERGEAERALEICRTGLEHHPSSILGRVIWGRALLARDDVAGAQDQFEIAIALDPASPYAYNLVGEALFAGKLYREALPVLTRAAELQPADERLRAWLEEARAHAPAARDHAPEPSPPSDPEPEQPDSHPGPDQPTASSGPDQPAGDPGPGPAPAAAAATLEFGMPAPPGKASAGAAPAGEHEAAELARPTITPLLGALPSLPPGDPTPPPNGPARHRDEIPPSLLSMIPGTRPGPAFVTAAPTAAAALPGAQEAEEITARFEEEVRQRLLSQPEPPQLLHRRHVRAILLAVLAASLVGAVVLFQHLRSQSRAEEAASASGRARAGLARDTVGALREASRILAQARKHNDAPELTSLAAAVSAVLATEHGDAEARALAADLAGKPEAGDGGRAAAYLLADAPRERVSSESGVLAAPSTSEPLLQALAGRILLRRGEKEAGKARLELASHATPPLLRALSDLGDLALAAGDAEGALGFYGAALSAQRTHPRSVVGAAEARLALGVDLASARSDLEGLAADPASAPPEDLRVRFEVASARVQAAMGDPAGAAARLAAATQRMGESAGLATAAAEIHLATRTFDRAEAAAARAVALAPGDAGARVLLARARIGRGRFAEALTATGSADGRAVWLQRGIARYHLGQLLESRRELERTAHEGRMPAEAAVWYALTDVRLGRAEQARALLEKLAATRAPPPLTSVALGQALEALERPAEAEAAYRAAAERDPSAPEAHAALGTLLLRKGNAEEAIPELQKAVAVDPVDVELRRAMGEAHLALDQPAQARADLDAVLLGHPADLRALELLSTAWLAEGQPQEARRAADRGLARAPTSVPLLLAAARAARAQGEPASARALADRAVKSAGRGPEAPGAQALLAEIKRR